MFGLYFGHYLVEKNKISQTQFQDFMSEQQKTRVKLGFIAVTEKLLTAKQAEEINDIQRKMDKKFGDIAIEKGYLLKEEVTYLLNMQGNSYLKCIQLLTESNILTIKEIEQYLEDFQKDYRLSTSELDALKSGNIDRIIPIFINVEEPFSRECASLVIRNIVRFISNNVIIRKAYQSSTYTFKALATQQMTGTPDMLVGLAGDQKALLTIADAYAKDNFPTLDEDAFDSVCEFLNCSNGLYASKLSEEDIELEMMPPEYYTNKDITSDQEILIVPLLINGEQVDIIVAVNSCIGYH